ncbi:hypothetical protein ACJO2E_18745 [Marinobacter sp. M1N3S26]|uniref:hypothetical protein n=1 Tax=unclassified Marinobacter TaxID=83889 RepID=UPI00387B2F1F
MKVISLSAPINENAAVASLREPRTGVTLLLAMLMTGLAGTLVHFGLAYDTAELIPLLENAITLELLASVGLAGLVVSPLLVYRHLLLLLHFVNSLRHAFLRQLRQWLPATPAPRVVPRAAHGCRAPPTVGRA